MMLAAPAADVQLNPISLMLGSSGVPAGTSWPNTMRSVTSPAGPGIGYDASHTRSSPTSTARCAVAPSGPVSA